MTWVTLVLALWKAVFALGYIGEVRFFVVSLDAVLSDITVVIRGSSRLICACISNIDCDWRDEKCMRVSFILVLCCLIVSSFLVWCCRYQRV